jgi:hypothetical protein
MMDVLTFIFQIHSLARWLVVAATVAALVWFLLVWLRSLRNEKLDRILMAVFSGLLDLQVLIGLILILWSGFAGVGFPRYRLEHAAIMIVAAVVGHLSIRWRKADAKIRARNNVILILVVLVLVYVGVALLPQGW